MSSRGPVRPACESLLSPKLGEDFLEKNGMD